jgi:hypothetical protein
MSFPIRIPLRTSMDPSPPPCVPDGYPPQSAMAMHPLGSQPNCLSLVSFCPNCLIIQRITTKTCNQKAIKRTVCSGCGGVMYLSDELLRFFAVYGHYISEEMAIAIVLQSIHLRTSLLHTLYTLYSYSYIFIYNYYTQAPTSSPPTRLPSSIPSLKTCKPTTPTTLQSPGDTRVSA